MNQSPHLPRRVAFGLSWSEVNRINRHIHRKPINNFWTGLLLGAVIGLSSGIGVWLLSK